MNRTCYRLSVIIHFLTFLALLSVTTGQVFECGTSYSSHLLGPGDINRDIVVPWNAPISRKWVDAVDRTFAAMLVSPSIVALSIARLEDDGVPNLYAARIYNMSKYLSLPGSSVLGEYGIGMEKLRITHFRFHPELQQGTWPLRKNHLVLAHLEKEVNPSIAVPVCVPNPEANPDFQSYLENLTRPGNEERIAFTGWNNGDLQENGMLRLKVLEREDCISFWSKHEETKNYTYGNHWCAVVGQENMHTRCLHKVVGAVTVLEERFHLVGFIDEFYSSNEDRECLPGAMHFFRKLEVNTYNWIWNNIRCGSKKFTCSDGSCVDLSAICNRNSECDDGSDEDPVYCRALNYCRPDQFYCSNYGPCIEGSQYQDGKADCENGADEEGFTPNRQYIIFIVVGAASIILIVTSIITASYFRKVRRLRKEVRSLTQKEELEFRYGVAPNSKEFEKVVNEYGYIKLPWDTDFEIEIDRIKKGDELSRGNFGVVYTGSLSINSETAPIAIKTAKPGVTAREFITVHLREAKMLAYVGDHPNIVHFFGACTQSIGDCQLQIVTELCEKGNLLDFLRKNRDFFVNLDNPFEVRRLSVISSEYQFSNYQYGSFDTTNLLRWALNVASGMEYLVQKNIVHGDLAGRNILLNSQLEAKIADFGLSHVFGCSGVYRTNGQDPSPWKWMSPEALKEHLLSEKSDVWSFGVLLWEILTLGECPYPGVSYGKEFLNDLGKGNRLERPRFSVDEIDEILQNSWACEPENRPSFSEIEQKISSILLKYCPYPAKTSGSLDSGFDSLLEEVTA